ncbi:DNA recombination protein RmuC [uncultured Stenotrophomonas sp.]|uniref:DNA recombination protein RmuC n=1 Tax=uncultured Stenotrophomonas sp. TaxID=165438 RepID=UPI0028D17234|nr:DNA recombination protein RmuC [uncultured Stenotrophomonas sp.]
MQPEFLILGGLLCAVLILQLVLLLRRSDHGELDQSLREEARVGRSELREQLEGLGRQQDARLETFARALTDLSTRTDQRLDLLRDALGEDARKAREDAGLAQQRSDAHMGALRQAVADDARLGREEATQSQQRFGESLGLRLQEMTQRNEQRMGEMRATLEQQLRSLQADNAQKLDQMRVTVDEKLQTTLEARLGASFQLVSDRLEQVQRGLGEMQQLATGVGDLKRVLTNVKNRGSWGEVQLDNILEQTLTQEQYARGVKVRPDSGEMVDIAVRLPGRGHEDTPVWLPIDSKFPREDYERLLDAQEQGDVDGVRVQGAQLERAIRIQAKSICDKYIAPPHTTDFAVMFLPTEGLYAEVIRRPGLVDLLQREHRVVVAGPTTVTALLNSLQMGFRTLAIEQRSSEVWSLLGAVKSEFGKFAGILEKAEKQISTVGRSLGEASRKTRTIERRLRGVESLGSEQTDLLLGDASGDDDEASADDVSAAQD